MALYTPPLIRKETMNMTNDYQNNNIEQSNDNECSGNIKIRLPKTLHQILIDSAKNDGVSLNQYCVHIVRDTPLMLLLLS